MTRKQVLALSIVLIMLASVFTGLSNQTAAEDVGADYIEDILSAPAGVRLNDIAWHPDENIAVAVGNDSANGYIYRYEPDNDNWVEMRKFLGDSFKGVTRTEPWTFVDDVETDKGWTTNLWSGHLNWQRVDPSTLPVVGGAADHGTAFSGSTVWWFGNSTTGDYSDPVTSKASTVSPVKHINDISTQATLSFQHWFNVESGGSSYDKMSVHIRNTTGDTSWNQIAYWDCGSPVVTSWTRVNVNISDWIGNDVQLNFTFDSTDDSLNNFSGWHIDDIQLESNGVFMVVGSHGVGSYSAFATDGYSAPVSVTNLMSFDLLDVAAGPDGTAIVVGADGIALLWCDGIWYLLNGPAGTDTLTAIDSNDTHFFIVGYNAASQGIAYYSTFANLKQGNYALYKVPGSVNLKFQDIAWSDYAMSQKGAGLGIIAADGNLLGLVNPEIWSEQQKVVAPSQRARHGMVYDSSVGKHVLFGGYTGAQNGETWTYDTFTEEWQEVFPGSSPPVRYDYGMVYDSGRGRVVMFGGINGVTKMDDTWIYNTAADDWMPSTYMSPPIGRINPGMAYHEEWGVTVMHGGLTDGGAVSDTWLYDIGLDTWTEISPLGSPGIRTSHEMVYDPINDVIVMFGGLKSGTYNDDTWILDLNTNSWTQKFPGISPSPRYQFAMNYDNELQKVVLFGGSPSGGVYVGDTWTFDVVSNTWENITGASSPQDRYEVSMSYDTLRKVHMMFGGNIPTRTNDTWYLSTASPWGEPSSITNGENFTAVAWDASKTLAIGVGHDTTSAVLYSYHAGDQDAFQLLDYKGVLAGHELYGVSFRPLQHGAEYALATGASAIKIWTSALDDDTSITVNVDKPHIFDHGLWKTSEGLYAASKLDGQLDIDTTYTFYTEVNYTIGGANHLTDMNGKERIEVMAWYDEGKTATSNPEPSWIDPENRTRQFRLMWYEQNGPAPASASMIYPIGSPGTDEFLLDSWWMDPTAYGADGSVYRFFFNVTFGPQARAADGNGFANGVGNPYYDKTSALNDPNSWDFRVRIFDNDFVNSANLSFGEFGIYRYTNITVSGNPGGNAQPGAVNIPLGPQSQITYSANLDHYVNVSIANLNRSGGGGSIPASNINVSLQNDLGIGLNPYTEINGDTWANGRAFTGAGLNNALCVWGNRTEITP
ncbi:MAG: hypothetical protein KAS67_01730, partial [Thermoplasmata archaeon]|nr:hypothetical protein [Thermoplasmata archaeon]